MKRITLALIAVSLSITRASAEKLSASQIKEIVEAYSNAIYDQDYDAWSKLLTETDDLTRATFYGGNLRSREIELIKLKDIEKREASYDVELQLVLKSPHGDKWTTTSWLQILPNGKIKYDIYIVHPITKTMSTCIAARGEVTYSPEQITSRKALVDQLAITGIPSFDYNLQASSSDQEDALDKIQEWLIDEGDEWDQTEPKIPCPESVFDTNKKVLSDY